MKIARVRAEVTGETSTRGKKYVGFGSARGKAPTKKTGRRQSKLKGQSEGNVTYKAGKTLPTPTGQTLSEQLAIEGASLPKPQDNLLKPNLELKQTLKNYQKIKVQLFPIDEVTRRGLEKDGHNPHLELILSDRKKIASVLKHLQSKWGGSSTAVGKLMLFPYNISWENLGGCMKWTLEDSVVCAGDVYAAVGRPPIFRLRYGWCSNLESQTCCKPLTFSCLEHSSPYENFKEDLSMNLEVEDGGKQPCKLDNQDGKPILDEPQYTSRTGDGLTLPSSLWTDSLTNISIGGLLSEASLNALADCVNPLPTGNGSYFQQIPFNSDSFDAAIAAHIYGRQDLQQPAQNSNCSLLDAEETCHAFPFQKFALTRKDVLSSSKSALSTSSQDVNNQGGISQDLAFQDKKADVPPFTNGTDALSSLGMPAISWPDSLGPLDLGLSSCRQLISGDSISMSGLLTSSLDAFQNCSFFAKDGKVTPS